LDSAPAQHRLHRPAELTAGSPAVVRSGLLPLVVFLLAGTALWFSLIAVNNTTDFATNRTLIGDTVSMKAIIADQTSGRGLHWRALPRGVAGPLLVAVIAYQATAAAFMWRAVLTGARLMRGAGQDVATFVRHANRSLTLFAGMFLGFLIGGLWFGYWMHLGPVQQVHFTLLIIGVLLAVLVNLVPVVEALQGRLNR
jgi:predicted small integral membrane protein